MNTDIQDTSIEDKIIEDKIKVVFDKVLSGLYKIVEKKQLSDSVYRYSEYQFGMRDSGYSQWIDAPQLLIMIEYHGCGKGRCRFDRGDFSNLLYLAEEIEVEL